MSKPTAKNTDTQETVVEGVAASPGIAIGNCKLCMETNWHPEPRHIETNQALTEIKSFRKSIQKSLNTLRQSHQKTLQQFGGELAEILELQIAFLEDEMFLQEIENVIRQDSFSAEYATFSVFRQKKEYFQNLSNEYFRDRALDIQNLKKMIILNLRGESSAALTIEKPVIIVADNLSPLDTVQLHRQKVLGFATNTGGKMSHTAIVARSLGVPAVVGLENITELVQTGNMLVLDGNKGKVIVNPSSETIKKYRQTQQAYQLHEARLLKECGVETRTKDNIRVCVHANIEFQEELPNVLRVEADGIGLYRTEGFFLNHPDLPTEDEQAETYKNIAEKMYPRNVVIRTLDLGGDKVAPNIMNIREENPFLGWRAIRFWLDNEKGFIQQLKAILRANLKENVQILLPMVSGLAEVQQVKTLLDKAAAELKKEGKPFGEKVYLGIMIEIPSAVIIADILAREVDFFSIGTNDLVQYTLAVDRGNEKVAKLYSHFHPAVLRMLKMTLAAAKKAGIPVGMCGEMAGDPMAIPILLAMGFKNLSVTHTRIPAIKKLIRQLDLKKCTQLYQKIENYTTANEIAREVEKFYARHFPENHLLN